MLRRCWLSSNDEPGAEVVEQTIPGAAIGTVNLSEVPFEAALAYHAGILRAQTHSLGLSLGDRACIALGHRLGVPVLTTDREWKHLEVGVEVRLIR